MLCCWGQTRPFLPLRLCLGHYFQLCAQIRWRSCTSTIFFHRHGIHKFNINKQSLNQVQVNWTPKGHVFPTGAWPSWAVENMWAPEIHFVNGTFVVYFTGWYKHTPDKIIICDHRGKRVTMDGPQSSRWSCGFNLRITLGTLHRS